MASGGHIFVRKLREPEIAAKGEELSTKIGPHSVNFQRSLVYFFWWVYSPLVNCTLW